MFSSALIFIGFSILAIIFLLPKLLNKDPFVKKIVDYRLFNISSSDSDSHLCDNSLFVIIDPETNKYKTIVKKRPNLY